MKKSGFLFLMLCTFFDIPAARAQIDCSITYEMIYNMRDPRMGSFNLWDTVHGAPETSEWFLDAMALMNGHTLAAGLRQTPGDDHPHLLLAEIDHRGRIVWQQNHDVKNLRRVTKVTGRNDGVLVLGETGGKDHADLWLGLFDAKGNLQGETAITGKNALHPQDIVATEEGSGSYLALVNVEDARGAFPRLYKISRTGDVQFERSYRIGENNRLHGLARLDARRYVAAGMMRNGDGPEKGWVALFDAKGNMIWQRPYNYNAAARLAAIAAYDDNRILVAGDTQEPGAPGRSGWIMMLEVASGDIIWQRRLRSGAGWFARDVLVTGDKISALFETAQARGDKHPYARLLTFDSRGNLLEEEGYFNGAGAHAIRLAESKSGARLVIGHTDMIYTRPRTAQEKKAGLTEDEITKGIDAWLVAGEEARGAPDRCAMQSRASEAP